MLQHLDSIVKRLIGKKLDAITRLTASEVLLRFGDGTETKMRVDGDCCSNSIFYEIVFPEEAKGGEITEIILYWYDKEDEGADSEEVALRKVKESGIDFYPEENSVWDVLIKTTKGDVRVRHINSSNGYYDGDVSFSEV